MSENGPGKIRRDKARTLAKPYSSEKSLIGRVKDRVKNMFTSGFWGQSQDILRPSFFGALNANSQDSNNSNDKRTEENNPTNDSMPITSEVSLPLKSNNVLSMPSVPSQAPNLTATPIFPREAVSVFPRKLNSISPLDNLRAVDNNKRNFDHQPNLPLTKPQFNSSLFSEGAGKQVDLAPKSPFYPGNTTFGGASSISSSYYPAPYSKTPIRRKVQAKNMSSVSKNNSKSLVTSSTAKRILETLENMSSPVTNAKKIPVYNDPGNVTFTPAAYSRRARSRYSLDNGPPVSSRISSKLNTTTDGALFSENTVEKSPTVKKISMPETTNLSIKPFSMETSTFKMKEPLDTVNQSKQEPVSNSLKMKTKVSSHAHYSAKPTETNPDYKLSTEVTLDLKTLPKFDFTSSTSDEDQTKRKREDRSENDTENKNFKIMPEVSETKSKPNFGTLFKDCKKSEAPSYPSIIREKPDKEEISKFSFAPGVKPSNSLANAVDVTLKNAGDFQFSRGISPIRASLSSSLRSRPLAKRKNDDINDEGVNDIERAKKTNFSSPVVSSKEIISDEASIKSSSSPSFSITKRSENSSTESNLLGKNKINRSNSSEAKELPKFSFGSKLDTSSANKKENEAPCRSSSFTAKKEEDTAPLSTLFKKQESTWDCPVCMINNADDLLSCQSCTEPKPGSSKEPTGFNSNTSIKFSSFLTDDKQSSKVDDKPTIVLNQGGGFSLPSFKVEEKKEEKSKEDKKEETKEKEKPKEEKKSTQSGTTGENSLAALFKKTDVWRCPSCDIENKNDVESCVCCSASKPGTKKSEPTPKSDSAPKFSFLESSNKTDKAPPIVINETGGGFKLSTPLTSTTLPKETTSKSEPTTATSTTSTSTSKLAFGDLSKKSSDTFVFGQSSSTSSTPPTFAFGQPSSQPSISFGKPNTTVSSTFGQATATATTTLSTSFVQTTTASSNTPFQFKASDEKSTTSAGPAVSSTFTFGKSTTASSTETTSSNKPNLFQFTAAADSAPKSTPGFTFTTNSSVNNSNTTKNEPFQFNPPATTSFSTGGMSFTTSNFGASKAGGFDSAKATTATATTTPFTFGQTTSFASDQNKFGGFMKGGATSTPSNNFAFGSPATSTSTFGSGGSSSNTNSNQPPQFNFGGQQPSNQNNGGSGIFQFSAQTPNANGVQNQQAPPTNSQGFNFHGAAASPAPSFNFGQQNPQSTSNFQFSATSANMNNLTPTNPFTASPVGSKRPIKKAARKLPRK